MVARTLGFIGLRAMGYPMALNLLKVLDARASLHIYNVSRDVLRQMQEAAPGLVHVCSSAREVAERSVGPVERFAEMEHPRADLAIRMSFSLLSPRERMSAACPRSLPGRGNRYSVHRCRWQGSGGLLDY